MSQEAHSPLPVLNISEHGESLVGNTKGFSLLGEAIDRLLDGDESSVRVDGDLEIVGLELSTAENHPSDPSPIAGISCLLIVVIALVSILGFAVFGFIQFLNII